MRRLPRHAPSVLVSLVAACSGGGPTGTGVSASGVTTLTLTSEGGSESEGTSSSGSSGPAGSSGTAQPDPTGGSSGPTSGPTSGSTSGATGAGTSGDATTGEPSEFVSIHDPLIGGTTGTALGGSFSDAGWTVTSRTDRIFWAVPRLVEGSVEFTLTGVTLANLPLNDHEVFAMYEGGHGIEHPIGYNPEFRNNAYKSMIRIYGTAEVGREGKQKLMWGLCPMGAPGYHGGECPCAAPQGFFDEPFGGDGSWDGSPQRLRVEWGGGVTRLLRNDAAVVTIDWASSGLSFAPAELFVSLGTSRAEDVDTAGMPIGAVFSDVRIEGWTGPEAATCG